MKDYSVLNGMIENQKSELRTAYDKGYNQCVKDFNLILEAREKEEEGYNRGLEDAWACCKRFLNSDDKVCDKIFGVSGWAEFLDQSPSDAIEKFKEYDAKTSDDPDNSKIEVGDEVIYHDPIKGDDKGVVIGMHGEWVEVKFLSNWNCIGIYMDSVKKTGRHFDEMDKLLKELEEKNA